MNESDPTANKQTRVFRQTPFAWWDKRALRLLRKECEPTMYRALKNVYIALCEIDSDFEGKPVNHFGETLATYTALSREQASRLLTELKRIGLIETDQIKAKDGLYTNEVVVSINSFDRMGFDDGTVVETVPGSTSHILEYNTKGNIEYNTLLLRNNEDEPHSLNNLEKYLQERKAELEESHEVSTKVKQSFQHYALEVISLMERDSLPVDESTRGRLFHFAQTCGDPYQLPKAYERAKSNEIFKKLDFKNKLPFMFGVYNNMTGEKKA
jgi:hypothetical protein